MAFYQVFLFDKDGYVNDDILLQKDNIQEALLYAEHRIDGSYGETEYVRAEVKRITIQKANQMFEGNSICWVNDYSKLEA